MAIGIDIGTLIVRSPEIRGGRPRIAGTGITVSRIVGWYKLGLSPEEIASQIPHLTLAQVYAALTYYHANREEIEQDLAEENTLTVRPLPRAIDAIDAIDGTDANVRHCRHR